MADTATPPTQEPSTQDASTDAPSTGGPYQVGELLDDGTPIVSASPDDTWDNPNTPVWLDGRETEADARPFDQLRDEQGGKVIAQAPEPLGQTDGGSGSGGAPAEGAVRDQIMRDLGWDPVTSAAMAAARHAADPERYPTLDSATYKDTTPTQDAAAAPPAPAPTPTQPPATPGATVAP